MYYSYISHDKVNQLLLDKTEREISRERIKKKQDSEKIDLIDLAKILELNDLNVPYGRSDIYHSELVKRESITNKLKVVIQKISKNTFLANDCNKLEFGKFYRVKSNFKVSYIAEKDTIVVLETILENELTLNLFCSLKYFSSNTDFSKPIQVNSSNYAFLRKERSIEFDTIFFLTSANKKPYEGSPLFLLIDSYHGNF